MPILFYRAGDIMQLGVITDIHNNLTALKVVIEKLQQSGCDKIVCCGDIIGIGPYPEETVQYLMQIPNLIAVRGNHEKYLLNEMPTEYPNEEHMGYEEMKHHKWEHGLLSKESVAFLRNLPYQLSFKCEGYKRYSYQTYDPEGNLRVFAFRYTIFEKKPFQKESACG